MGWTEFIKYLASGYLVYYGILVVLDLLKPQHRALVMGEEDLLEFPEEIQTTIIDGEEEEHYDSPAGAQKPKEEEDVQWELYGENVNASTGGVSSITDLFRLAQDETIEVKKHLVY